MLLSHEQNTWTDGHMLLLEGSELNKHVARYSPLMSLDGHIF